MTNFELFPEPPAARAAGNPWPEWPAVFRVDYAHEESAARFNRDPRVFSISTEEFVGDDEGRLTGVKTASVEFRDGRFSRIAGTERVWKSDLVFLSMGYLGPEHYVSEPLGVALDKRSNYKAGKGKYRTSVAKVFAAGDCRSGQSLVVRAFNEGREAAREIDRFLTGSSELP